MPPTVEALTRLGSDRDPAAWAAIVDGHAVAMRRICHAIVGDAHLAEDALHDALLAVRDGAARFRPRCGDPETAAIGWLRRVAVCAATDLARRQQAALRRERLVTAMPADEHTVDGTCAGREETAIVRRELAALPERHRTPLVLHFVTGMDYPQLAGALRLSVNAARLRIHRSLRHLERRLTRAGVCGLAPWGGLLADLAGPDPVDVPACLHLLSSPATATAGILAAAHGGVLTMTKLGLATMTLVAGGLIAFGAANSFSADLSALPAGSEPPKQEPVQREAEHRVLADHVRRALDKPAGKRSVADRLKDAIVCDFEESELTQVLTMMERLTGIRMVLAPDLQGAIKTRMITLKAKDMSAETALRWITSMAGCSYEVAADHVLIRNPGAARPALEVGAAVGAAVGLGAAKEGVPAVAKAGMFPTEAITGSRGFGRSTGAWTIQAESVAPIRDWWLMAVETAHPEKLLYLGYWCDADRSRLPAGLAEAGDRCLAAAMVEPVREREKALLALPPPGAMPSFVNTGWSSSQGGNGGDALHYSELTLAEFSSQRLIVQRQGKTIFNGPPETPIMDPVFPAAERDRILAWVSERRSEHEKRPHKQDRGIITKAPAGF